jgi:hypothetical protein
MPFKRIEPFSEILGVGREECPGPPEEKKGIKGVYVLKLNLKS